MRPIIRSKTQITISKDLRSGTENIGFVQVEITKVNFNTVNKNWELRVEDFKIIEVEENQTLGVQAHTSRERIKVKIIKKTPLEMDGLFTALGSINNSTTFNELLAQGLLLETQERPIYETTADDWEIKI